VRVVVDRVDQFADGRLAIIDYKSGRSDRSRSWADARIVEPQLPIYAALAFPDRAVAAVALARVTREAPAFLGVAENEGLLPDVKALDAQRRRFGAEDFPDWEALRALLGDAPARDRARGEGGRRRRGVRGRQGARLLRVRPLALAAAGRAAGAARTGGLAVSAICCAKTRTTAGGRWISIPSSSRRRPAPARPNC
jgi:hypothetical protein